MSFTKLLPLIFSITLILGTLVGKHGKKWGVSEQNVETTEGLLFGLSIGLMGWFGYHLWKGDAKNKQ